MRARCMLFMGERRAVSARDGSREREGNRKWLPDSLYFGGDYQTRALTPQPFVGGRTWQLRQRISLAQTLVLVAKHRTQFSRDHGEHLSPCSCWV